MNGGSPPAEFNHAILVLLPKKPSVEVDGTKWYGAKDTRPLSVVNADNRIIANVFRKALASFAEKVRRPEQRGFLNHRYLMENIIDIDFHRRKMYLEDTDGSLLLVDRAAALPLLSQEYLFQVLQNRACQTGS